jgi:hypothetical protein
MTNKEKKLIVLGLSGAMIFITVWLFLGIFRDREWSEQHLFLKHRPSFKFTFYSPRGEADPSSIPGHEGYISPKEEAEEQAYIEFVEEHGGYRRSVYIPLEEYWLPLCDKRQSNNRSTIMEKQQD